MAASTLYEYCSDYSKNPARGRTLVIFGSNGSGKTRFARSISKWQQRIKHLLRPIINTTTGEFSVPDICFVNWPEIVDGFKNREGDGFAVINDMRECTLLILDDLGADHDPSGIGVEKIYTLLNAREFHWNIITTNYPPDQWAAKFENRVDSRLWRNAIHIDLSGVPDFSKI